MLEKTFRLEAQDGNIVLGCKAGKSDGTTTVRLQVVCPSEFTLSVFEAKKLAKGILDTIDFGSMI